MKRLFYVFIGSFMVFLLIISSPASAKDAVQEDSLGMSSIFYVDVNMTEKKISRLKEDIRNSTSLIAKLKLENAESQKIISHSEKILIKVEKLIVRVEKEAEILNRYSMEAVDSKSSELASNAYIANNKNRHKLRMKKKELTNTIDFHTKKTRINNEKININNKVIENNEKVINQLEASIKKTKDQKNDIKSHAELADNLISEFDAILKDKSLKGPSGKK